MLNKINALIRANDICVLATAGEQGPHTSLMAYACSPDCRQIYLVTPRQTLKYRNMRAQPSVSLLVDTRETMPRGEVRALTINGRAVEIADAKEAAAAREVLGGRHPQLKSLLALPDLAFIRVGIETLQLLEGPQASHFVRLPGADAG